MINLNYFKGVGLIEAKAYNEHEKVRTVSGSLFEVDVKVSKLKDFVDYSQGPGKGLC